MTSCLRRAGLLALCLLLGACTSQPPRPAITIDHIAARYVQLTLALNRLHPGELIVSVGTERRDASPPMTAAAISRDAQQAIAALHRLPADAAPHRRRMLVNQLGALSARAKMLDGWRPDFDDELRAVYDVEPPAEVDTDNALLSLDTLLPPTPGASLAQRYDIYLRRYAVSGARLQAAFRSAIAALRRQSAAQLPMPIQEQLQLQPVVANSAVENPHPWEMRERYLGDAHSQLQLNLAQPMTLARVIELAACEGYPGRHVGDSLRQVDWVAAHGWIEFSVLPRYSPLAFVAEGRARVAVNVALTPAARAALEQRLFRQAGFDPADAAHYDRIWGLGRQIRAALYPAARKLSDGLRDPAQTRIWVQQHALLTPADAALWVAAVQREGVAAISGPIARQVVERWLTASPDAAARWVAYRRLTEVPMTPLQLQRPQAQK